MTRAAKATYQKRLKALKKARKALAEKRNKARKRIHRAPAKAPARPRKRVSPAMGAKILDEARSALHEPEMKPMRFHWSRESAAPLSQAEILKALADSGLLAWALKVGAVTVKT